MHTLAIVGAGPYGLAAAARATQRGVDYILFGKPMEFWERNMPRGMLLRSSAEWHLDPAETSTFEAFLGERGFDRADADPIPLELYVEYGRWFRERIGLHPDPSFVACVERVDEGFELTLEDGRVVGARNVLAAPGFRPFRNIPDDLVAGLPPHRYAHTCDLGDLSALRGKRILIVGGRQSAFETAALARECGAATVHVVHRHDTPRFEASDWSWVDEMMRAAEETPGWFRSLPAEERQAIHDRFWAEGRLKLEPWLGPRISHDDVRLHPRASVTEWSESAQGDLLVALDTAETLAVDFVVLATGYRVRIERVPYLSRETILPALDVEDGFAALDESFQSSVPGLYFTGLPATKAFGPFFGFVRACPAAARIVVEAIRV
jgi:cation diffusion facilitator CzcD-associated flavoprotein CzcO